MSEIELDEVKVLIIGPNKNMNVAKFPIEENKVIIKKDKYEPFFDAECIFPMKEISTMPIFGKMITKRRKREPGMIYILGKPKAEKLKNPKDDLFEPLTDRERKQIVKREVAKTLGKFKPMSTAMFAILFILLMLNIVLNFMTMKGMRF